MPKIVKVAVKIVVIIVQTYFCNHSTAYGVLLTSYAISLYELWNGEKTIKENIINSILLSIQFFLGILDIKGIQIFNMCRDR